MKTPASVASEEVARRLEIRSRASSICRVQPVRAGSRTVSAIEISRRIRGCVCGGTQMATPAKPALQCKLTALRVPVGQEHADRRTSQQYDQVRDHSDHVIVQAEF